MALIDIVAAGVIIFLAGMLQSVVGFGYALFATPLLVWIGMPLPSVITLVATCSMLQAMVGVRNLHAAVPWRLSLSATAIRLVGLILGLFMLKRLVVLDKDHIRAVIGMILCVLVAVQLLWNPRPVRHLHWRWAGLAFMASGVLAGLCGMGGPPLVLWSMAHDWPTQKIRGFLFATFATSIPIQVALLTLTFGMSILWFAAIGVALLPLVYAGSAVGLPVGNRFAGHVLRRVAYAVLFATGVSAILPVLSVGSFCMVTFSTGGEMVNTVDPDPWRQQAVDHARLMSRMKWTPVADGIPIRGKGAFRAGSTYTGVPYSNGGWDGRRIGFDVPLRTFQAAVENPKSVLYTTDLRGQRRNAAAFYGTVCSSFTSYALQVAISIGSAFHGPSHREGIEIAQPQSAQGAQVGDVLWFSGHVEIVTDVTTAPDGRVTHVRVEDSWPPTTRTKPYTATQFDDYLAERKAILYRITDLAAWRGANRAERFLFPNYAMDSTNPAINRVLLLDLGDWVVYRPDQPVLFNIMDRDRQGVGMLVIEREGEVVERITLEGPGIVERAFAQSGDYTAHCIMKDGSASQACEFSVCLLDSSIVPDPVVLGNPWEIVFRTENMKAIHVQVGEAGDPDYADPFVPHDIWLSDDHRRLGRVRVPGAVLTRAARYSVFVTGESRYGRLRNRHVFTVVAAE